MATLQKALTESPIYEIIAALGDDPSKKLNETILRKIAETLKEEQATQDRMKALSLNISAKIKEILNN